MSFIKHGEGAYRLRTAEYRAWSYMLDRCRNPRNHAYSNYGGRGIKVCDRWLHDYRVFLADMGRRPSPGHSIDRINNDGNYEPGNCRWATAKEQANNQRPRRKGFVRKTVCLRGHPLAEPNLYFDLRGIRHCLACKRLRETERAQELIMSGNYRTLKVLIPVDAWPAVEEFFRLGARLTGSRKRSAVFLAAIAECVVEWSARAAHGEQG